MSMSQLDDEHARIADDRFAWYEANQRSYICADCKRVVVEYAPERAGVPCDHTAYCARCVRDHVAFEDDDDYNFRTRIVVIIRQRDPDIAWSLPVRLGVSGPGAQSYKAHVANGSVTL